MFTVAIIIPYFQRDAGILNGCVKSILAQDFDKVARVHLIIVDDASPLPAEHEIAEIDFPSFFDVRIIRQENGGPGAARNTGLDRVPKGTQFVAFIDSDDRWNTDHLGAALSALDRGYDLYFCDYRDLDQAHSHYEFVRNQIGSSTLSRCGLPDELMTDGNQMVINCIEEPDIFAFTGTMGLRTFIKCFLAHASTVVLRFAKLGAVRFDLRLRSAAEDYLFVLAAASNTDKICFSSRINMHRGRGISMYKTAVSWDSERNLTITLDNLRCFILAANLPLTSVRDRRLIRRRIMLGRAQFTYLWLRKLLKLRHAEMHTLYKASVIDRGFWIFFPATLYRVLATLVRKGDFSNNTLAGMSYFSPPAQHAFKRMSDQ